MSASKQPGWSSGAELAPSVTCDALETLERAGLLSHTSDETQKWWRQHKLEAEAILRHQKLVADQAKLRQIALSKLTPEEKAALGIGSKQA